MVLGLFCWGTLGFLVCLMGDQNAFLFAAYRVAPERVIPSPKPVTSMLDWLILLTVSRCFDRLGV